MAAMWGEDKPLRQIARAISQCSDQTADLHRCVG